MTDQPEHPDPGGRRTPDPFASTYGAMASRNQERRERMMQEILANRRGGQRVPTWVLACVLAAMIGAIVAVVWLL
jgi:hypothetical protein